MGIENGQQPGLIAQAREGAFLVTVTREPPLAGWRATIRSVGSAMRLMRPAGPQPDMLCLTIEVPVWLDEICPGRDKPLALLREQAARAVAGKIHSEYGVARDASGEVAQPEAVAVMNPCDSREVIGWKMRVRYYAPLGELHEMPDRWLENKKVYPPTIEEAQKAMRVIVADLPRLASRLPYNALENVTIQRIKDQSASWWRG